MVDCGVGVAVGVGAGLVSDVRDDGVVDVRGADPAGAAAICELVVGAGAGLDVDVATVGGRVVCTRLVEVGGRDTELGEVEALVRSLDRDGIDGADWLTVGDGCATELGGEVETDRVREPTPVSDAVREGRGVPLPEHDKMRNATAVSAVSVAAGRRFLIGAHEIRSTGCWS